MRVICIILSSVACLAVQYFFTLSHKWHDFLKSIEYKFCFLIFYTKVPAKFWIVIRIQRDVIINVHRHSGIKHLLLLSYFNLTWNFLTDFRKCLYIKFNENLSSGGRLVLWISWRTDRQTDMTKPIVAFRNSANTPKNVCGIIMVCHIISHKINNQFCIWI